VASTGDGTRPDNDGVVERLSAIRQRRHRRSTARCPLTTGCVDSAASADQLHTTAMTVHRRRRTTWVDDAGSGHAHSSHGFNQFDQSTIYSTKRPFKRTDNFKLLRIARFSVDIAAHECTSQRPALRQSVKNSVKRSRRSARSGGKCRYKRTETTET